MTRSDLRQPLLFVIVDVKGQLLHLMFLSGYQGDECSSFLLWLLESCGSNQVIQQSEPVFFWHRIYQQTVNMNWIIYGIHAMKFILFYEDIVYPEIVVNVLTSYTRDILQSAF